MELLQDLAGYLYWIFLILTLVGFLTFVTSFISSIPEFFKADKEERKMTLVSMFLFLFIVLLFGFSTYSLSGPAGQKPFPRQWFHNVVNFINPFEEASFLSELEMTLQNVGKMRIELDNKKELAEGLITYYQIGIAETEQEILRVKRQKQINDFAQAQSDLEIINALKLIQRRKAYITELENVIKKVSVAVNELDFLQKTAEDDLLMNVVFNKEELDKLKKQIDQAIAKYEPGIGDLAIDIKPENQLPLEQIWREINQ